MIKMQPNNDVRKIETMTSRERVLKAIRHEPVDRMPIDLGAYEATGISAFAYWNLREYLGLSTENIYINDMVQVLARVDEDILKKFHCDCINLNPAWKETHRWNPHGKYNFTIPGTAKPKKNDIGDWTIEHNGIMRMPEGGFFFDGNWLRFHDMTEDELIKATAREAERLYKDTNYFIMYKEFEAFFGGSMEWLCKMLTDPEEILQENQQLLENNLRKVEKVIKSMGKYIQGISVNSDLGFQNGPSCSPAIYEELCAPFLKKFCTYIHENSDLVIFMHSCGSIKPYLPILIDCGIDVISPVQISAANMEPEDLKKEFGNKISFWGGGCDTQNVLNNGSVEEVRDNVRKLVRAFKPNSGYVFNQVHNIMGDIKPEKVIAMFETAYEESFY